MGRIWVSYDNRNQISGRVSMCEGKNLIRERSGYGSGNRVKAFSLSGVIKLAGLNPGKAKTLSRACFSLTPQPGLAGLTGLCQLGWVRPLPLNPDRVNFPFLKSFINSNHFNPNLNLNYERLLHVKQNTHEHFIT
jgi:hypothetical protein